MVASIDGSTVSTATRVASSSKADQEVLLTLRDLADVLIVGAATVRIEGYGPPRKGQRVVWSVAAATSTATTAAVHQRGGLPDPSRGRPADRRWTPFAPGSRRGRSGRALRNSTPTSCRPRAVRCSTARWPPPT